MRQKCKGFQVKGTILTKFAESIAFKLGCGITLNCKDVEIEGNSNRRISSKAKLDMQTNAQNFRKFLWEKLDIYSLTYISIQKVRHLFIYLKQFLYELS